MKNKFYLMALSLLMLGFFSCKKDASSPVASFMYSGDSVVPATIMFTNTSTDASTYLWDFGDNTTSTDKSPSHKYTTIGKYTVKLTATGDGGTNSISKTITVIAVTPTAAFTFAGDSLTPLKVVFTNTTTTATSYAWDFGDNQTSTDKSPSHTYTAAGIYTVKLTSTNDGQTNSTTKTITLPTAQFSFTGTGIQVPCQVTFTNSSTNATSYLWDFGDGQTSTEKSPVHTYTKGANFNVKLTTKSSSGFSSVTQQVTTVAAPSACVIGTRTLLGFTDDGSLPYIGIRITQGGSVVCNGKMSISSSNLPFVYNTETAYSISSANWGQTYHIEVATYSNGAYVSTIGYAEFKVSDYATLTNHYPSEITVTNGDNKIKLALSWSN